MTARIALAAEVLKEMLIQYALTESTMSQGTFMLAFDDLIKGYNDVKNDDGLLAHRPPAGTASDGTAVTPLLYLTKDGRHIFTLANAMVIPGKVDTFVTLCPSLSEKDLAEIVRTLMNTMMVCIRYGF